MDKPKALKLAEENLKLQENCIFISDHQKQTASELRRLHAENEQLKAALEYAREKQEPVGHILIDTGHFEHGTKDYHLDGNWESVFTTPPAPVRLTDENEIEAMKHDIEQLVTINNSLGGELIDMQKTCDRLLNSLKVILKAPVDSDDEGLIEHAAEVIEAREVIALVEAKNALAFNGGGV